MDYPISVPSIGLVDGKFVDEDPLVGTPGSLIPAQWGNSVTEEILSVITAAGLTPDEHNNAQLLAAISTIIGTNVPAATELVAGRTKIATQAQVTTGTDDTTTVSPKKLAARLSAGGPVTGAAVNLKMTVAAVSATANISADEVVVKSALGGSAWTLSAFNKPINLGSIGAGGMDTGASPASGYVAIYAIYNPTTGVSALLAKNATSAVQTEAYSGANMPAGFTASALVSVWPTSGSGQFVVGVMQCRQVSLGGVQVLSSSVQQPSFVSLSLSAAVPLNSKTAKGYMRIGSSSPANNLGQISANAVGLDQTIIEGGYTNATGAFSVAMLTPQTLFYTAGTSAGTLNSLIVISSYTF